MQKYFLILSSLILLSYGFLISAQENNTAANIFTATASTPSAETNLTKEIAQKISVIAASPNGEAQQISADQLKNMVSESLNTTFSEDELPPINKDAIKIKKQNYSNLSEAAAKEKEKADAITYTAGLFYIFNSNLPNPVSSLGDLPAFFTSLTGALLPVFTAGDTSSLDQLSDSGEKILEQMNDLEVPEKLIDAHLKGLRFAQYAALLKTKLTTQDPNDPVGELANLSQISGFLESLLNFSTEASQILSVYIPENDTAMTAQLDKYGITVPLANTPAPANTTAANSAPATLTDAN